VGVWDRLNLIVCSIYLQAVFIFRFLLWVKYLVLIKLDVANGDDFSVLWDLYAINIAALITNKVADVYPGLGLVSSFILACQNLFSDRIGSTAIGVEICSVWLVY